MKKEFINYILLKKVNNSPLIEIILADDKDSNSAEIGFAISGVVTTYNERNENGGIFKAGDFDKFVRDYFKKNGINMVCPIEHNDYCSFGDRGIVDVLESDDKLLTARVIFYKETCPNYDVIKGEVKYGILQGFSTYGWIMDTGDACMLNFSLVSQMSDKGAKLFKNTKFIGFDEDETEPDVHDIIKKNNFFY